MTPRYPGWEVIQLDWDLSSTVLAVGLRASPSCQYPPVPEADLPCCVQLYARHTYYWHSRQQWTGTNLQLLGFDSHNPNRMYMSQQVVPAGGSPNKCVAAVRIVDICVDALAEGKRLSDKLSLGKAAAGLLANPAHTASQPANRLSKRTIDDHMSTGSSPIVVVKTSSGPSPLPIVSALSSPAEEKPVRVDKRHKPNTDDKAQRW